MTIIGKPVFTFTLEDDDDVSEEITSEELILLFLIFDTYCDKLFLSMFDRPLASRYSLEKTIILRSQYSSD